MTLAIPRALAVVLFVLCASLPAHAHDQHSHHGDVNAAASGGLLDASPHHRLSPSCPGTPGHLCCCGSLVAVSGTAKLPAVASPTWRFLPAAVAGDRLQLPSLPAPAAQPPSQARPRGPPVSS